MTETGKRPLDTLSDPDPAIMGLDYRMVEWHHEDGTYSLVQVVSRSEAAAIEAEAVAAHEVVLRERGWMDEYEVETAAAMNFGDGQAAERARIVAGVERLREALSAEHSLTARHHRRLRVTRRTCSDCWASDHARAALAEPKP